MLNNGLFYKWAIIFYHLKMVYQNDFGTTGMTLELQEQRKVEKKAKLTKKIGECCRIGSIRMFGTLYI